MADAWNSFKTDGNDGMTTEVISYKAANGDSIQFTYTLTISSGG